MMEDSSIVKTRRNHPKEEANFLSSLFFCWTLPIFCKGYKSELKEADLPQVLKDHESGFLGDQLERAWESRKNNRDPSLAKALWKIFGLEIALYGILPLFCEVGVKLVQPLCLAKLLAYYSPNQTDISKNDAYLYAGFIVGSSLIIVMCLQSYIHGCQHLGMKIRIACSSLIYRKTLKLNKASLAETTVGQIINLLSNDVKRFDLAVQLFHQIWIPPLQVIGVMYFLYTTVGVYSLVGVLFFVLLLPLQMYLGRQTSKCRERIAKRTDERVRLMSEIIDGIQVIKMYAWEKPFTALIECIRRLEIKQIKITSYIRGFHMSFIMFMNTAAIFLCIVTYVLTGHQPDAQIVFVVSSFYNILSKSMVLYFPRAISTLAETNVSLGRITKFLLFEEVQERQTGDTPKSISIVGGSARWSGASEDCLHGINMEITNELVGIIGPVGSGKSSLLQVILKELPLTEGKIDVKGCVSYASQEPWLFASTIRQNILFNESFDEIKYQLVIKSCALEHDFALFPYGDRTLVGEKGVQLSGGQKARINLARAIYKDADIYLLDDPLSAVDARVGAELFSNCICNYLQNKCVLLVTHQLQYLSKADKVCLFKNGSIEAFGTYQDLKLIDDSFTNLFKRQNEEAFESQEVASEQIEMVNRNDPNELQENKAEGSVKWKHYLNYIKAGGNSFSFCFLFLTFVLSQVAVSSADYFVAYWVNLEQKKFDIVAETNLGNPNPSNETLEREPLKVFLRTENCIYVYIVIVCTIIALSIVRSVFLVNFCMRASGKLHSSMFTSIVHATMSFFNCNPSGRILNRFSKDMGQIDEVLPSVILDAFQIGLKVLGIIIVVAAVNYWILIPTSLILLIFFYLRRVFLSSSRDIKRMEGIIPSYMFSHLTQTFNGLATIRAFNAQNLLIKQFDQQQDLHSSAFHLFLSCNTAFGMWLDLHCVIYIALVTFSFLFLEVEKYGGNVGLGITQSLALTGLFQWGMRQWSELENQMTSVERVVEYTQLQPEKQGSLVMENWPSKGQIRVQRVSLRYSPYSPYVLKDLNFKIKSGEKIGIVGRSGAGKSSIISALFRLAQINGAIFIDEIDTSTITLEELRSKISIIPQEPFLFSGTLRKNLDPFHKYQDIDLWNALEDVELKSIFVDSVLGLDTMILDGGSNLSVGQRQLLCLARAILQKNKILVLDEATANVDPHTDKMIQKTIRKKFSDYTILTIAHRLETVMDSDKVLVLKDGEAEEFDHPYLLLDGNKGLFFDLVKQTGKANAIFLKSIAERAFLKSLE